MNAEERLRRRRQLYRLRSDRETPEEAEERRRRNREYTVLHTTPGYTNS